jgi:WD40 repeat protein
LVLSSTIKAVSLVAAGQAARVHAFTERVLKAMLKLRTATAGMLLMAVAGVGVACLLYRTQAGEPPRVTDEKNERPLAREGGRTKVEQKPVVVAQDTIVLRLVWSSDGRSVTTVGNAIDKYAIEVWDAKTGELKQSLGEVKNRYISAVAVSPDGKTAAIAAGDLIQPTKQVRLLDTKTWQQQDVLDTDGVTALAFSPDGKKLAIVGSTVNRSFLKLWDLEEKDWIRANEDGRWWGGPVSCLAFSPDGKVLAVGDRDANIRLFDGETGKLEHIKHISADHGRMILSIAFSPDSKTFVSTSFDNTVDVWDVETRKLLRTLDGNPGWVPRVAFTPDGKYLVTAGRVNNNGKKSVNLSLWDAKTGKLERSIPGLTHSVYALAFSPDGKTLAIGAGDLVGGSGKTTGELRLIPLESLIAEQK